jgi:hypothetical protein
VGWLLLITKCFNLNELTKDEFEDEGDIPVSVPVTAPKPPPKKTSDFINSISNVCIFIKYMLISTIIELITYIMRKW